MTDQTTAPDTTNSPTETQTTDVSTQTAPTEGTQTAPLDESGDTTVLGGVEKETAPEGEQKPETPPATVPDKYELALADEEGNALPLDEDMVALADPVLRNLGLTNEQANELTPVANALVKSTIDRTIEDVIEQGRVQSKTWLDEAKADEAIGGSNFDQTVALSAQAMDAMGFVEGHPFRAILNSSGLGNHPDMLRVFSTLGKVVAEDGSFATAAAGAPSNGWGSRYKD